MTDTSKLAIIAALAITAYVLRDDIRRALKSTPNTEGWWVKLYNYPPGDRDRKLKTVEGPFDTEDEARDVAEELKDVWYPQVSFSRTNPLERA